MWNIKALALTVQKLLARLKFQRGGQNDSYRMTEWQNDRQDKNNMPPDLRSRGHKNVKSKYYYHRLMNFASVYIKFHFFNFNSIINILGEFKELSTEDFLWPMWIINWCIPHQFTDIKYVITSCCIFPWIWVYISLKMESFQSSIDIWRN